MTYKGLATGEKAPDFTAKDQEGNTVQLTDYAGKKVALYFYPKDNTPGCTLQACNLKTHHEELQQKGYVIVGVSSDTASSHQKFIKRFSLPFTLLADTDKAVQKAYHVLVEKSMFGKKYMGTARITFIINEEGIIEKIIDKVKTSSHHTQF